MPPMGREPVEEKDTRCSPMVFQISGDGGHGFLATRFDQVTR